MAPISLFDEITMSVAEGGDEQIRLRCNDPALPAGDDNLAVKAVRLLLRETGRRVSLTIDLKKGIPHGAGLAGGSSDAASVLLGLNRMLGAGLTVAQLAGLAAEIGSDVPFFIFESAAICRGRGEMVDSTKLKTPLRLLLLKPSFGVPTPWAYGRWKDSRELPGIDYRTQEFAGHVFVNDLERPVFEKHLFLAQAKTWLRAQPEVGAALMSGSGSTLFVVLRDGADSEALAARAKEELDPELWTHACETRC